MKTARVFIVGVFAASMFGAATADSPVHGVYKTEPGDDGGYLYVRVGPCEDKPDDLCGVIDKAFTSGGEASTDYEHLGKTMLWGMQSKSDGRFGSGKIWAPDRDKTYKSKMQITDDGLKVKGCVGPFCRSQNWERVQ